jgi:hypothetical protein
MGTMRRRPPRRQPPISPPRQRSRKSSPRPRSGLSCSAEPWCSRRRPYSSCVDRDGTERGSSHHFRSAVPGYPFSGRSSVARWSGRDERTGQVHHEDARAATADHRRVLGSGRRYPRSSGMICTTTWAMAPMPRSSRNAAGAGACEDHSTAAVSLVIAEIRRPRHLEQPQHPIPEITPAAARSAPQMYTAICH